MNKVTRFPTRYIGSEKRQLYVLQLHIPDLGNNYTLGKLFQAINKDEELSAVFDDMDIDGDVDLFIHHGYSHFTGMIKHELNVVDIADNL